MRICPFLILLFSTSLNAISINFDFENLGTLSLKLDESLLEQTTYSRAEIENFGNEYNSDFYSNMFTDGISANDDHLYNFLYFPLTQENPSLVSNIAQEVSSDLNIPNHGGLDLGNLEAGSAAFMPNTVIINQDYTYKFNLTANVADIILHTTDPNKEIVIVFSNLPASNFIQGNSTFRSDFYYLDHTTDESVTYLIENITTTVSSVVPEPSTYALILGAVALGFTIRRRK